MPNASPKPVPAANLLVISGEAYLFWLKKAIILKVGVVVGRARLARKAGKARNVYLAYWWKSDRGYHRLFRC